MRGGLLPQVAPKKVAAVVRSILNYWRLIDRVPFDGQLMPGRYSCVLCVVLLLVEMRN